MTENRKILFVDDEPNVLDALRRLLRRSYDFDTATSGQEGLAKLDEATYAVIVSDMRMPGMTGDVFLAHAHVKQPEAIQLILSGQADLTSTVAAVNDGAIFRFLMKPADREVLTGALDEALRQYELLQSEKQLLEETLSGAVEALSEVLRLVSPAATRRTGLVVEYVQRIAPHAGLENDWQLRLASLLHAIGYSAVPADVVERSDLGHQLSSAEQAMVERHPKVAATLLGHIPRLEGVAGIVTAHTDMTASPPGLEAHVQVLKLASRITDGILRGHDIAPVVASLRSTGEFEEGLLIGFESDQPDRTTAIAEVSIDDAEEGMSLRADVYTETDVILAAAGTVLTPTLIERLHNFASSTGVRQPILVEFESGARPESAAA